MRLTETAGAGVPLSVFPIGLKVPIAAAFIRKLGGSRLSILKSGLLQSAGARSEQCLLHAAGHGVIFANFTMSTLFQISPGNRGLTRINVQKAPNGFH